MCPLCLVKGEVGVDAVVNDRVIWNTGDHMRVQNRIIRKTGGKGGGRLEEVVEGHKRLNIRVGIDAPVLEKNTEPPEVRLDRRIRNGVKDLEIDRGVIHL